MNGMSLNLIGDGAWPDLDPAAEKPIKVHHVAGMVHVVVLQHGMQSGRPSVSIRVDLEDGSAVVIETSARLFCGIAETIRMKFRDEIGGDEGLIVEPD